MSGNQAVIHTGQLDADTPDVEIKLALGGQTVFDNVWLILNISATAVGRTMDIYGKDYGQTGYRTAVLVTQIDIKANDGDRIAQDISGKGPLAMIKLDTNIASAETIDYTLACW